MRDLHSLVICMQEHRTSGCSKEIQANKYKYRTNTKIAIELPMFGVLDILTYAQMMVLKLVFILVKVYHIGCGFVLAVLHQLRVQKCVAHDILTRIMGCFCSSSKIDAREVAG